MTNASCSWPNQHQFAFTIFDDPDSQTIQDTRLIYSFLADLGFRTTKGVWPSPTRRTPSDHGLTCGQDPDYDTFLEHLVALGFEMGLHNVTSHSSFREEIREGLDTFVKRFGQNPKVLAHHYFCEENLYWGDERLTSWRRLIYNIATRGKNHNRHFGHIEGHPMFWGDLCRERIQYVRNFVFTNINTLAACPEMPYFDPDRPFVNRWYASSEGANINLFNQRLSPARQDQLVEQGGACIMYVHFGHGFQKDGKLDPVFVQQMTRLSRMNGWFVPVSTLLDHLAAQRGITKLTAASRASLERRWLTEKLIHGTH